MNQSFVTSGMALIAMVTLMISAHQVQAMPRAQPQASTLSQVILADDDDDDDDRRYSRRYRSDDDDDYDDDDDD
ncbi:hypothetical protein [Rhizobium sp. RM]|uniref:hypothetical protein n=1 Tax=Rhizobium sp. RM TaxID=2748079 RepID=UPI00110D9EF4|nr:hypothetical protein [Rhizobium sp. RM]NWJ25473.1 hypothetical protein [Rhizobium sp. RM]TMV22100.1 hypothetical protein BJG94_03805 [Rhizobium sp. Td3]